MELNRDDADADFLAALFAAARVWEAARGRAMHGKVLREALWFVWQQPRLPRPLFRSKYPMRAPWTAAARDAYGQDPYVAGSLVMEHVEPISGLIRRLLDTPQDMAVFVGTLNAALRFCVVSAAEDKLLGAARVGSITPMSDDPWIRYRLAGIDVPTIGPLAAEASQSSGDAGTLLALRLDTEEGLVTATEDPKGSDALSTLRSLGVAPGLLDLLPSDVPFVLKESQGASGNLPPVSSSHHSPAAVYVDKTCFWVALHPDDARRYSDLSDVKIAEPSGNQTTWRLIVHAHDTKRAEAVPHLRKAVALAINRSLTYDAAAAAGRSAVPGRAALLCPVHFEGMPVGSGVCSRCSG